jgi:peptidoglycan hydrolase-like protein with peptidoglycan-binding domain
MKNISLLFILMLLSISSMSSEEYSRELRYTEPRISGNDVLAVQKQLLLFGFNEIGEADGWFGPLLNTSIKKYQNFISIQENGVIDKNLWDLIFTKDKILLDYYNELKIINSINYTKLVKEEKDFTGRSSQGGELLYYYYNKVLKYITLNICGELGKVEYKIFVLDNRYVVLALDYSYPDIFDVEHAKKTNTTYYYTNSKTYEIQNGKVNAVKYDLRNILYLIK